MREGEPAAVEAADERGGGAATFGEVVAVKGDLLQGVYRGHSGLSQLDLKEELRGGEELRRGFLDLGCAQACQDLGEGTAAFCGDFHHIKVGEEAGRR
jgi:hypothetical protein